MAEARKSEPNGVASTGSLRQLGIKLEPFYFEQLDAVTEMLGTRGGVRISRAQGLRWCISEAHRTLIAEVHHAAQPQPGSKPAAPAKKKKT